MTKKLANKIATYLCNRNGFGKEDFDVYEYGIEVILCNNIPLIVMLIIGIVTGTLLQTIIFSCVFRFVRTQCGGYHAETSTMCFIITIGCYLMVLALSFLDFRFIRYLHFIIFLTCEVIFGLFAPVDSPNKHVEEEKKNIFRMRTLIIVGILYVISVLLYSYNRAASNSIVFTIAIIAVFLLIQYERRKRYEKGIC